MDIFKGIVAANAVKSLANEEYTKAAVYGVAIDDPKSAARLAKTMGKLKTVANSKEFTPETTKAFTRLFDLDPKGRAAADLVSGLYWSMERGDSVYVEEALKSAAELALKMAAPEAAALYALIKAIMPLFAAQAELPQKPVLTTIPDNDPDCDFIKDTLAKRYGHSSHGGILSWKLHPDGNWYPYSEGTPLLANSELIEIDGMMLTGDQAARYMAIKKLNQARAPRLTAVVPGTAMVNVVNYGMIEIVISPQSDNLIQFANEGKLVLNHA